MKIGRKLFIDKVTGAILVDTGEWDNVIREKTVEEDVASYTALSERNRETFDVLELAYGAYANDFREGTLVGVDLVKRIPKFAYPNEENPSEPIAHSVPMSVQIEEANAKIAILEEESTTNTLSVLDLWDVVLGG